MIVDHTSFDSRAARTRYVASRFADFIEGRVLDVGCDQAPLRELVSGIEYTGLDISGAPDIEIDLERVERLPFDDGAFDTVLCCDVLEHVDSLHRTFEELVRVCGKNLIVSLPNCWAGARQPIHRGRGSIGHYGLPLDEPGDRHKWFFSFSEAVDFLNDRATRHGLAIEQIRAVEKSRPALTRALRRVRYPVEQTYLNRYAHSVFAVLGKR